MGPTMNPADWTAIFLTARLAAVSTILLLVIGLPLGWWLARTRSRWRTPVNALVAVPLVLPPTVLGFYLLLALSPNGFIGAAAHRLGLGALAFTFTGLVIGSIAYSLPFIVQPIRDAFLAIPEEYFEAAATLGASRWDVFRRIAVPLASNGILSATILGFAHTVGEFGVALMIGGSMPGRTRVVSIELFNYVEAGRYDSAHLLAAGLTAFSFSMLLAVYSMSRRSSLFRL